MPEHGSRFPTCYVAPQIVLSHGSTNCPIRICAMVLAAGWATPFWVGWFGASQLRHFSQRPPVQNLARNKPRPIRRQPIASTAPRRDNRASQQTQQLQRILQRVRLASSTWARRGRRHLGRPQPMTQCWALWHPQRAPLLRGPKPSRCSRRGHSTCGWPCSM